ncbi:hypothetical protein [Mycolicibacterium tusciae]|uniref:hypothetical protein n=1 Tax=Mycolicibacterium tusciae TaxID=75922 RepID=UPI001EF8081A|nr:hypothetical protein [Mycolicibacterium tusciae]
MRAFPVSLPSGQRYWTVLDEDLHVVGVADEYLRHLRFGRDAAESTTKAYAHSIALFLSLVRSIGALLARRCRGFRTVHKVVGARRGTG